MYHFEYLDDELEVDVHNLKEGVDYEHPETWVQAYNRSRGETGLVPGNFLQFIKIQQSKGITSIHQKWAIFVCHYIDIFWTQ